MPELPEVETVVRDLRPLIVGARITALETSRQKLRRPWQGRWTAKVIGTRMSAVERYGKWIVIALDPQGFLLIHLGMTGQLTVAARSEPRADHTHVILTLAPKSEELRFRDIRRFGSVEWFAERSALDAFLAERLGPEPERLDPARFADAVRGSSRPLKAILLDQAVVAGVGNIYADEALHRAGLHPGRRGVSVTPAEAERLRQAIATVILAAIERRGSTIRDYVGGSGLRGEFQNEFLVYGRTGEPCPGCGAPIVVARIGGRSSHHCVRCQPGP